MPHLESVRLWVMLLPQPTQKSSSAQPVALLPTHELFHYYLKYQEVLCG